MPAVFPIDDAEPRARHVACDRLSERTPGWAIDRLAEREPGRAQQVIKTALQAEAIRLWPSADGSHLRAEYEIEPARLATGSVSICVVAGARLLRLEADWIEVELR